MSAEQAKEPATEGGHITGSDGRRRVWYPALGVPA
jgi:hypothetical protein